MDGEFLKWRQKVLAQVRFWPDRAEISQELTDHYEDHCCDLQRLGMDEPMAAQRTLAAMGDPDAVGEALNRVHMPWLGWLWEASRVLIWIAVAIIFLGVLENGWPSVGSWLDQDSVGPETEEWTELRCPEPFRSGPYTVEVTKAEYTSWNPDDQSGWLNISLSATTPRLWLDGPILDRAMEAVDSEGTVYRENTRPCINAMSAAGHGRSQGWIQMTDIPADVEWVEIHHRTAGWSFRIILPRGEEASA